MTTPGFTADASLYRTRGHYRMATAGTFADLLPQGLASTSEAGLPGAGLHANLGLTPCDFLAICCAANVPLCCVAFYWRCVACPALLACCLAGNRRCCKAWVANC